MKKDEVILPLKPRFSSNHEEIDKIFNDCSEQHGDCENCNKDACDIAWDKAIKVANAYSKAADVYFTVLAALERKMKTIHVKQDN